MSTRLPTEERQAGIVVAALRRARDVSPGLVTTAELAADVGITQGAVFKHFPTKDAIWLAAMGWVREGLLAAVDAAAARAASPMRALEAVFAAHVDFIVAHPGVPRLIFHELQRPADSLIKREVRGLLREYRKRVQRLLQAAVDAGEAAPGVDLEAASTLFLGVVQGLVVQSMAAGGPAAMKTQAGAVFALFHRGIAP